jgi:hypothetical protein
LGQIKKEKGVTLTGEDGQILREIKRVFATEMRLEGELDQIIRRRLHSYSRRIVEGSPEWDVLYQKSFAEEMKKRKR